MKKLFVFLSVACMFAACTKDDATNGVASESKIISSQVDRISYNEALQNAKNATDLMEDGQSRSIDLSNGVKAILNGNDTLLYVFNYKEDKGYAIVSATKKAPDFKIISEVGNLDPASDKDSANTNFTRKFFMEKIVGAKTRGTTKTTTYNQPSLTYRYVFEHTDIVEYLKDLSAKQNIFNKYTTNAPGYVFNVTKTNLSQSEIENAIDTNNNYALIFKYYGTPALVTEYTKLHTDQYLETRTSTSSPWKRVCKCAQYDSFSFTYQLKGNSQIGKLDGTGMTDFKRVSFTDREKVLTTQITSTWENNVYHFDIYLAPNIKNPTLVIRDYKTKYIYYTKSWNMNMSQNNIYGIHDKLDYVYDYNGPSREVLIFDGDINNINNIVDGEVMGHP